MAEQNNPFRDASRSSLDNMTDATARVKEDVEHLIEGFDFGTISKRVEEFGRENPVGLAVTALTVGVAVGFLMRNKKVVGDL